MQGYKYILTIPFSEFGLWDYKRYSNSKVVSKYKTEYLGTHIENQSRKEILSDRPNEKFGILGVNNKTGMFDAYEEFGKNINQAYKICENDYIAYNPYRVNVGSIGMKNEELSYRYISPAYVVFSCQETLLPKYLFILLKSNYFNTIIRDNTSGSVRQNLTFDALANMKIPVPRLEEQEKIVQEYEIKINQANEMKKKSDKLTAYIDDVLFEELGIEKNKNILISNDTYIKTIAFETLVKWGVELNLSDISPTTMLKSKKYGNKSLGILAEINPTTDFKQLNADDDVTFLPMECISDTYGEILEKRSTTVKQSKGYTKFKENDIIWAKITPCMQNGKSAIVKELINNVGCGSTEYHVIRVDESKLFNEYVYHILRTNLVRNVAKSYFSGSAGQQRVSADYLEHLSIPIPSLVEQRRIADKISKIKDEIKALNNSLGKLLEDAKMEFEREIFGE